MAASIFYSLDNQKKGSVSFKRLLERMFPEASSTDIKVLLHMARPKDYVPKAKPDQGVRVRETWSRSFSREGLDLNGWMTAP